MSPYAQTGNAVDFGNLRHKRIQDGYALVSITTRVLWRRSCSTPGAGIILEFITISTTGNATDFGDLDNQC